PKVEAVKSAFNKIAEISESFAADIEFLPSEVDSGIAKTPMSVQEMMLGASNRVNILIRFFTQEDKKVYYFLGMEGGLFQASSGNLSDSFYLQSWVYATNGKQGHFGSSPAVQIPNKFTAGSRSKDFELAEIVDRIGKTHNNRDRGGAFSLLTKGLLTRQAIFEAAVLAAMAPFYNSEIYT
ncbi:MAG: DUF84 family protein, partial [bacterium]